MAVLIALFIAGSLLGSFLNVCIYRLPRSESIVFPASHCVHCNRPIPWYDNIPFLSYLILRGKCRYCARHISPRYFLVEGMTGAVTVLLFVTYGFQVAFAAFLLFSCLLIVASFIDFEHQLIPDVISLPGIALGMILSIAFPQIHHLAGSMPALREAFAGALVGGGSIFLLGVIGSMLFKKEAMGGGDVKLMAMIGTFLGWKMTLLVFFIAPLFGSVVGIIAKVRHGEEIIPYGPYLSLAAFLMLLWGDHVLHFILFYY